MASYSRTEAVELNVPDPVPIIVDPNTAALVVVDMQNDFCRPEGALYSGAPRRDAVVQPIQRLLKRCRDAGLPRIFVQSIRYPDSPEFTVFGHKPHLLHSTWGSEYIEELAPVQGEVVVEKNSHDPFYNTRMEQALANMGIAPCKWTILVVGLGLTNCVGCTISGFSVRNYWVVVPMDCTASRTYEEELSQYQRFMQAGYSYNVALTSSDLIEIAARPSN